MKVWLRQRHGFPCTNLSPVTQSDRQDNVPAFSNLLEIEMSKVNNVFGCVLMNFDSVVQSGLSELGCYRD